MAKFGGSWLRRTVVLMMLVIAVSSTALGQDKSDWPAHIVFMTGPTGGAFYTAGGAVADILGRAIPDVTITVIPGGTVNNVKAIEVGRAHLALGASSVVADAILGNEPFDEPSELIRHLATLWAQPWQFVVRAESGIHSISDLEGKRITAGARTQAGEVMTQHALAVHGLNYSDLARVEFVSGNDAVSLMKDRIVDGWSPVAPMPYGFHLDLASSMNIRLVGVDEDKLNELQAINPAYARIVIPSGMYAGVTNDVVTFGDHAVLIVSADLPQTLVEAMANALLEGIPILQQTLASMHTLTPELLGTASGLPQHPAATHRYAQ